MIHEIVQQALTTGRLSAEAETLIGQLLHSASCTLEDLNAYMSLQLATMAGRVQRESLELASASY
ncbi:MAG: hypothetical protein ACM37W_08855 [Actinomycetota bacterium]